MSLVIGTGLYKGQSSVWGESEGLYGAHEGLVDPDTYVPEPPPEE